MLANATRTFLPDSNTDTIGAEMTLTLDERNVLTYGRENVIEFFDSRRNRDIRAVMASNRADFLS